MEEEPDDDDELEESFPSEIAWGRGITPVDGTRSSLAAVEDPALDETPVGDVDELLEEVMVVVKMGWLENLGVASVAVMTLVHSISSKIAIGMDSNFPSQIVDHKVLFAWTIVTRSQLIQFRPKKLIESMNSLWSKMETSQQGTHTQA